MTSSYSAERKRELMRRVRDEVYGLTASPLYAERTKNKAYPVIGEGSHDARIVFIGEAPGRNEARTGRPFCGAAGKILDGLLEGVGIRRDDAYITNIVKDRPPGNRDPFPDEIEAYAPFLDRQIEIIRPEVIATLGRYSMKYILERFNIREEGGSIGKIHGRVFEAEVPYGKIKIIPLYHPAAAIYNREVLHDLKKDFATLAKL